MVNFNKTSGVGRTGDAPEVGDQPPSPPVTDNSGSGFEHARDTSKMNYRPRVGNPYLANRGPARPTTPEECVAGVCDGSIPLEDLAFWFKEDSGSLIAS